MVLLQKETIIEGRSELLKCQSCYPACNNVSYYLESNAVVVEPRTLSFIRIAVKFNLSIFTMPLNTFSTALLSCCIISHI